MNKENSPLVNPAIAAKINNKDSSEPPPNLKEVPVKFCKDCMNYDVETDDGGFAVGVHCKSNYNYFRDVVTGDLRKRTHSCHDARQHDLFCGMEAKWFIPKRGIKNVSTP